MIIEKEKREVLASGNTKQMFIKANGKAFKVLASSLYKNLTMAVLREYSQNSFDSHIKAGKSNVPFKISLPTIFNPILIIEDFGTGMSPSFLEDNENGYLSVFSSTKCASDSFAGGYGIGKLSALGLVDSYII
jgi:hypothetical protein